MNRKESMFQRGVGKDYFLFLCMEYKTLLNALKKISETFVNLLFQLILKFVFCFPF